MNGLVQNMVASALSFEVQRERVSRIMGTPEWLKAATSSAIKNGAGNKDSSEIGAAGFISFVTFLVCLFNCVRFGLLFYKSRNNEKLVATDMTFTSTE